MVKLSARASVQIVAFSRTWKYGTNVIPGQTKRNQNTRIGRTKMPGTTKVTRAVTIAEQMMIVGQIRLISGEFAPVDMGRAVEDRTGSSVSGSGVVGRDESADLCSISLGNFGCSFLLAGFIVGEIRCVILSGIGSNPCSFCWRAFQYHNFSRGTRIVRTSNSGISLESSVLASSLCGSCLER